MPETAQLVQDSLIHEILAERGRQDLKWGLQNHDSFMWLAIEAEEFGEVARALNEGKDHDLHDELVQVAAVALAWLENMHRDTIAEHETPPNYATKDVDGQLALEFPDTP